MARYKQQQQQKQWLLLLHAQGSSSNSSSSSGVLRAAASVGFYPSGRVRKCLRFEEETQRRVKAASSEFIFFVPAFEVAVAVYVHRSSSSKLGCGVGVVELQRRSFFVDN
ncbi:hypothetical protein Emag_004536 [Eimeria magna]